MCKHACIDNIEWLTFEIRVKNLGYFRDKLVFGDRLIDVDLVKMVSLPFIL